MTAPAGMPGRSPVIGGGDWRTMLLRAMVLRSSTVAEGDNSLNCAGAGAEGVRRCFIRYDADRGSAGLVDDVGDMGPPPFCGW